MKIAVIGNSSFNVSFGMAADFALAGHSVSLASWPDTLASLDGIRESGLTLQGAPGTAVSQKRGKAPVRICDIAPAVDAAEVVFLDMPAEQYENNFSLVAPHLQPGQVVHIDNHGYWPGLRLWPIVARTGVPDVTLTESAVRSMSVQYERGVVTSKWLRTGLPVAAMPARNAKRAQEKLKALYPTWRPAANVLETGFANLNMLMHPAMALLNVGWFDRAEESGEQIDFYGPGNTASTTRLALALDAERRRVCEAWNVSTDTVTDYMRRYYAIEASELQSAIATCSYYASMKPTAPDIWRRWLRLDVKYAHVPFVRFARLVDRPTPLHDAVIAVSGALLDTDFAKTGLDLASFGLSGASVGAIQGYVNSGSL